MPLPVVDFSRAMSRMALREDLLLLWNYACVRVLPFCSSFRSLPFFTGTVRTAVAHADERTMGGSYAGRAGRKTSLMPFYYRAFCHAHPAQRLLDDGAGGRGSCASVMVRSAGNAACSGQDIFHRGTPHSARFWFMLPSRWRAARWDVVFPHHFTCERTGQTGYAMINEKTVSALACGGGRYCAGGRHRRLAFLRGMKTTAAACRVRRVKHMVWRRTALTPLRGRHNASGSGSKRDASRQRRRGLVTAAGSGDDAAADALCRCDVRCNKRRAVATCW